MSVFVDVRGMIEGIMDFFRYMVDNKEARLYYQIPILPRHPYAYQQSPLRDIATIGDILDGISFCKEQKIVIEPEVLRLFEKAVANTLLVYHELYQKGSVPGDEASIGDVGFFLLCLQKAQSIFPSLLPRGWQSTKQQLKTKLLARQNSDGSLRIFFDDRLAEYEKSSEAFYLPEGLIGLIFALESEEERLAIEKACLYCTQERVRRQNMISETATFYANWQFQLFYHAFQNRIFGEKEALRAKQHLLALMQECMKLKIANESFGRHMAAVEVACYLEGLAAAKQTLEMLGAMKEFASWFEKEKERSLWFLFELQKEKRDVVFGGFVHYPGSSEARVDVAGHVLSALLLLESG
jgi:hypothetical protein